jgi:hypothetical protein
MRFGEKCPNCGYQELKNWRPRFINTEIDIINYDEVPELTSKMVPNVPYIDGQWVYYMPKTRRYILRVLKPIFDAWGREWVDHRPYRMGLESGRREMMKAFNRNLAKRR